jgi:hypothetical protein
MLTTEDRGRMVAKHGDLAVNRGGEDYCIADVREYARNIQGLAERLAFHKCEAGIDLQSAKSWTLRLNAALDSLIVQLENCRSGHRPLK